MAIVIDDGHAVAGCEYEPFGGTLSAIIEPTKISHFRHHSYIHDQETGLYYLQSRYYDAKVGRFLNADAFTYTGQGILGNNMFAYCNNRPAISVDLDGYDAIILINKDSVTHIGIMVQDENGTWWHFYWGAGSNDSSSSGSAAAVFGDVAPRTWCDPYAGDLTVDAINSSGQYSDYEDMCYLSGDFSACIDKMKNAKGMYNLYTNNCSQVSLGILAEANTQYQSILESASDIWLPYVAFIKVKALAATMEGYNKMTDNVRKIVDSISNFVTNGR